MTAEEIRNKTWECYGQPYDNPIQAEIAAQLAEANELKRIENAAPDMLAALKAIRGSCPTDPDVTPEFNQAWDMMDSAIAKAAGGQ